MTGATTPSGHGYQREGPEAEGWPTIDSPQALRLKKAWETPTGWRYFSAVNNTEVGKWYMLTAFVFFLCAGVLALLMRIQLAVPGNTFLSPEFYNQAMTLHGSAMMFLFAVPIVEALAISLLPQLVGSRDLPFPRLSAFGFWCFLIGGTFVLGSILFNAAPQGGWFMYPPLSTDTRQSGIGADIWLLGLSFIEVASIAAAVELIVGVLKCRAPGMRIGLMPLYAWYILVVGAMIVFAFPPLITGDLLFELARAFDFPFFDAKRGGDPLLWQHLFWIFGHPEVYIIFLPAIALVAMIVPTFARTPIFGYSWIVLAAIGTGFLSFGLWAHHMFTTGLPAISLGFFSAASAAVAIPTGIQIFALIATVLLGRVVYSTAMLFVAGALAIFVLGGLTGVMVAIAPFDWQAHDTYFIVAHLHHTLLGGMLFPVFAGIYYYYPLVTSKLLSERLGRWAFWLMFIGFNVTFLPMHFTGLRGMPRRVVTYPDELGWNILNMTSTVGAFIFAAGVAIVVYDVLRPRRREADAPRNVWNAGTLEWVGSPKSVAWGLRSIPIVSSRYPLWDDPGLVRRIDNGGYYLPDAPEGLRETLVTSVIDARPIECLRVPGPTWLTLIAAVFLAAVFIFPVFQLYTAAAAGAVLFIGAVLTWLWTGTARMPEKPGKEVGLGLTLPLYTSGPASVGWWAMLITMLADAAGFTSLVFAYFYLWTVNEVFPPAGAGEMRSSLLSLALLAVMSAWGLTLAARRANRLDRPWTARLMLLSGALMAVAAGAALLMAPYDAGLDPTEHAYQATVWTMMIWAAAHFAVGILAQLYCLARSLAGLMTSTYDADIWNTTLYWHFMLMTGLVTIVAVGLGPLAFVGAD